MRVLTDDEIADLINEQKPCPQDWREQLSPKAVAGKRHAVGGFSVEGAAGNAFRVLSRFLPSTPLNFSIILRFDDLDGASYRLLRCNGAHGEHTNTIERELGQELGRFSDVCHVHRATERYQLQALEIDTYAVPTEAYHDFWSAVDHMQQCARLVVPPTAQRSLQDVLEDESQ